MAFNGDMQYRESGVLSSAQATVLKAANAATTGGAKWDYYAFWLTAAAATDAKGSPVFSTVGRGNNTHKMVLPVPANLPDEPTSDDLNSLYVGKDQLSVAVQLLEDLKSDGWLDAWKTVQPTESTDIAAEPSPEAVQDFAETEGL